MRFPLSVSNYTNLRPNSKDNINKRVKELVEGDFSHSPDNDVIINAMSRNVNALPVNHIKRLLRKIVYHIKVYEDEMYFFVEDGTNIRLYKLGFYDFDNLRCTTLTRYDCTKYVSESNNVIYKCTKEVFYPINNFFEIVPLILLNNESTKD